MSDYYKLGDYIRQYPKFCHGKTSLPLKWLCGVVWGMPRFFRVWLM